jgi:hypothetical protein
MEQRLAQVLDPFVAELFDAYRELKPQFFADLADEREAYPRPALQRKARRWIRRSQSAGGRARGRGPGRTQKNRAFTSSTRTRYVATMTTTAR